MTAVTETVTAWWREPWHRALTALIVLSIGLNATGILWGLPGYGWAGDEITPGDVLPGIALRFSHGWWSKWPPLQYYLNAVAYSPFLILSHFHVVNGFSPSMYSAMLLAGRLVSLIAGAGTLVAVYLCGARAFSKRAGFFAAASLALAAPFVYYAKTANTDGPWLFWCVLSLVFFLRLLNGLRPRDFLLFAVTATLAVCAKDQAYGFYLAVPAILVYELWQRNLTSAASLPLVRALMDRWLLAAAGAAAVMFVALHNLIFNIDGFLKHVRYITGGGSADYRMFEPTFAGRLHLLALTATLDRLSWGWPLLLLSTGGFFYACTRQDMRRWTLWLAIPVATYYLGFVNVILYNYDRFLLPVIAVQALFAGVAIDWLVDVPRRGWGSIVVAGAFAYSLLYTGTVDVLMLRDSRYDVETWMHRHVGSRDVIGTMFPLVNLPRLDDVHWIDVDTVDGLRAEAPGFYVLNADYARAVEPQSAAGQLVKGLQDGSLGYALELRYRSPSPWPWLPGEHRDLVGPRRDTNVASMLRYINPTMEIFQRVDASR